MLKKIELLLVVLALGLGLAACGATQPTAAPAPAEPAQAQPEADGQKLKVMASTSLIGDLVANVAGGLVELKVLVPVGADLHTYSPTPQDLAAVADAEVIFVNGLGAEETLLESLHNAGGEATVVEVSQGVETRQMGDESDHAHEADEADHADDHTGVDPHVWMTPHNAVTMVGNIEQALVSQDSANAQSYRSQAAAYISQLEDLDNWVKSQIETIPTEHRKLVTDHAAFGYYADRYGLTQVGAVIPSFSTAAEPSAQDLAALQDAIIKYDVPAIFVGNTVNPVLSQRVAQDTGKQLFTLYHGSLGPAGSGVETYLQFIQYNTNTIVKGLQ